LVVPRRGLAGHVRESIVVEFDRLGAELPAAERIGAFALLDRPFSIESGELTPTLKLRRGRIAENRAALLAELYQVAPQAEKRPAGEIPARRAAPLSRNSA
jgi:long-subunit acyl-CoA synthetase (AMP-forming)